MMSPHNCNEKVIENARQVRRWPAGWRPMPALVLVVSVDSLDKVWLGNLNVK
jgi:hypothetical protein